MIPIIFYCNMAIMLITIDTYLPKMTMWRYQGRYILLVQPRRTIPHIHLIDISVESTQQQRRKFLYVFGFGFVLCQTRPPTRSYQTIEIIHLIVCKATTEDANEFENAFQLTISFLFFVCDSSERLYISFWQNVRCNLHTIRPCALILIPSSNLFTDLNRQINGWSGWKENGWHFGFGWWIWIRQINSYLNSDGGTGADMTDYCNVMDIEMTKFKWPFIKEIVM